MSTTKKILIGAIALIVVAVGIGFAVHRGTFSSINNNPGLVGGGGSGSIASGTVLSLGNPLTIQGNATSTIYGVASTNSTDNNSYIPELDRVYAVPLDYATNGCNGSSTLKDFGGCVNSIYANAPSQPYYIGIQLPCGITVTTSTWQTPINFGNFGVRPSLFSSCGANLVYGGTGNAITWNFENPTGHLGSQDYGWTLQGNPTLIAAGQTNTATTTGIMCGGSNGCVGVNFHDLNVNGFGRNIATGANAYMDTWNNVKSSGGNCGGSGMTGCLFYVPGASNSGEFFALNNFIATDPGNTTSGNAIYLTNGSVASFQWCGGSMDDVQMFVGASNGSVSFPCLLHVENSDGSAYGQYIPFLGVSSDLSTSIVVNDLEIANDFSGANTFGTIFKHGGQLAINGFVHIDNYGGGTISNLVDHSLDNGLSSDHVCNVQVQSGALTNIIAGGGGNTWSQAKGVGCSLNVANSFTINMYPNGNNTNNIDSGNTTVATFDHSGNWVLGNGSNVVSLDVKGSSNGGIGSILYLDNRSDTANDAVALYAYDGTSATPIRGAIVWKDGSVGQTGPLFYSGNATDTANMKVIGGFSPYNNGVTTQTAFSVGTSTFITTGYFIDGVNNSSTVRIGKGTNSDQGCMELYTSGGTLTYTYAASATSTVTTSTKPTFCE